MDKIILGRYLPGDSLVYRLDPRGKFLLTFYFVGFGWVASWLVNNTEISAATNTMGTVTGEKINIRSESNDQAAIIGSVTKGTELTVLYQENGWLLHS